MGEDHGACGRKVGWRENFPFAGRNKKVENCSRKLISEYIGMGENQWYTDNLRGSHVWRAGRSKPHSS